MSEISTEEIEIDLLLEAIYRKYGYDFRQYSRASITRRIRNFMLKAEVKQISEMIPMVLCEQGFIEFFIENMSVTVSEMFRDPFVFKMIREKVISYLKTYPHVNVWIAGCARGEEVYSLAIMLKEEGLLDKVRIYATDINEKSMTNAKEGIFPSDQTKINTANYNKSGGRHSFSDYCFTKYGKTMMQKELKENVFFSAHNLAVDGVFNQMQLIFCRNVIIYFNQELQNRVLKLFYDSLCTNGFLCLGTKEDIMFSEVAGNFKVIGKHEKIYQKKN
jgi:chemotaxis protein methyltransferase CheR